MKKFRMIKSEKAKFVLLKGYNLKKVTDQKAKSLKI